MNSVPVVKVRSLKLSRSFINQTTFLDLTHLEDMSHLEVLGWVYVKEKFILLQDNFNYTFYKVKPIQIKGMQATEYGCSVSFTLQGSMRYLGFTHIITAQRFIDRIKSIMAQSIEKGQIYI